MFGRNAPGEPKQQPPRPLVVKGYVALGSAEAMAWYLLLKTGILPLNDHYAFGVLLSSLGLYAAVFARQLTIWSDQQRRQWGEQRTTSPWWLRLVGLTVAVAGVLMVLGISY